MPTSQPQPRRLGLPILLLATLAAWAPVFYDTAEATRPVLARAKAPVTTQGPARKAKKPRRKGSAPVTATTLVKDVRVKAHPDYTRLVLDLQRSVPFTQNRLKNPDRVIIELQHSQLGEAARAKLAKNALPEEITIAQPNPRSVTVSLNLAAISDYKLLPLTKPDRLVFDVYGRADVADTKPAEPHAPQAAPSPPPPVIKSAQRPARDEIKTIVIDPGHGGKDPGAVGRSGLQEKDITLQVGLVLRDLIRERLGTRVLMTRDRDVFVELGDRAKFANSHEADLFVSIHVNSHPHRSTKGLEVYHFGEASDRRALEVAARENGTPINETGVGWQYLVADLLTTKKIEESQELAWTTKQAMVAHLDDHYDVMDHGVKTAPFYVIRFTTMPSILAEIAFISNPIEERLMRNRTFLTRMAEAIFQGVQAYVRPLQTASR
ncbi:MAG: N-acetylmuramoyl-L-alanine amidase [Nitrospirota bacterium]